MAAMLLVNDDAFRSRNECRSVLTITPLYYFSILFFKLPDPHRSPAHAYHHHAALSAYNLIVQVDTDDGIDAHGGGLFLYFLKGDIPGLAHLVFVGIEFLFPGR